MSAPKATTKKPATAVRVDPKKVANLRETFPFLSEEAATNHLLEANGNMAVASDLVLNGERWQKTSSIKPRKPKAEEKVEEKPRRPQTADRKPREDREPRPIKRTTEKAAPAAPEVTAAQVQQKEVASNPWVKGQGLSFAEMVKRNKEVVEAPVVVAPPPPPPAPPVEEPAAPVAAPEPAAAADAQEKPAKQRRERKPRAEATAQAAEEAVAPVPAVVAPVVVAKPVIKHVLRYDRIEDLLLPPHVTDLALRNGSLYTFNGTPGVEQSPPPQPQPVNSFQHPQSNFMAQRWGPPEHNVPASQPRWDHGNNSTWGQPNQTRSFTAYQPPQQQRQQPFGFNQQYQPAPQRYGVPSHHNHHRGHDQQASSEAYNAIRENNFTHPGGAVW